jgi:hypothetical protein
MPFVESEIYNLASESLETRRIPDPYFYLLNTNGKLALSYTGEVVEDNVEKQTYLGKAEFEGLLKIQNWAKENSSGTMIWISPPYKGVYDTPKIGVHEIINTGSAKILFNRAIVLDNLTATDCLLFARDLSSHFPSSIEELRRNPIPLQQDLDWLDTLSYYIDVTAIKQAIDSGQDILEKEEAIRKAREIKGSSGKAIPQGFYGNQPLRCKSRTTAFQLTSENALQYDIYGSREFECPHCHQTNTRPENKLIATCQHCGNDVRCGSSS